MTEASQKYPDGDCRRRPGGPSPVRRSTSKGRGTGRIGDSVLRATAWEDLGDSRVEYDAKKQPFAVNGSGAALFGSMALMVLARFARRVRGR